MKFRSLILILLFAVPTSQALPQQPQPPLTKGEVMDLVKFGMSAPDLAEKIKRLGIGFEPTDDYLQSLRNAGAQEAVIQALREVRPKPMTREQVGKLVAGGVPSERAAALVKQRGIDFLADEEYLRTLQLLGAGDTLIAALRDASAGWRAKALAPSTGTVRENPKDGLRYVRVPPGTFMMGCSPGDDDCADDEKPPHRVTITVAFWLGQTEVMVGAYKRFAAATGRQMPRVPAFNGSWADESMPIVYVDWNDAHDFCAWAGGRLPTEAEWEYAARAGSTDARYGLLDQVAWNGENSDGQTHPRAEKQGNGFGLYDTLGSVWEWVDGWYDPNYYQGSPPQDPSGPTRGEYRILRGGSWSSGPRDLRVSGRAGRNPAFKSDDLGFRCGGEVIKP